MHYNNIILFGGKLRPENLPSGYYSSLAMLPIKGKPLIWWQLNNAITRGIFNIVLVLHKDDLKTRSYVENIFSDIDIDIVVSDAETIIGSLKLGLHAADPNIPTRLWLGDSYLDGTFPEQNNVVLTSSYNGVTKDWCLVDKDTKGIISNFYDKMANCGKKHKETVIGYYTFSETAYLQYCVEKALAMDKKEISDVLTLYMKKIPLKTSQVDNWIDLGHTGSLASFKNKIFNARGFNAIEADTELGLLIKTSSKTQKLADEAFWYQNLPEDLVSIAPRFLKYIQGYGTSTLIQELYGYPTLAELYISGEVSLEDWNLILKKLFVLHKRLELHESSEVSVEDFLWLYRDNTLERLELLNQQSDHWINLFNKDSIIVNGVKLKNFFYFKQEINQWCEKLSRNAKTTIIHGDYCFSNILFDPSNFVFRLIDPRGRIHNSQTIYGDPRYDMAKLRHSICGLYDFIVNDLYKLIENKGSYNYNIFVSDKTAEIGTIFNRLAKQNGFDIKELQFIEGLLFLSMLPLHVDVPERQTILYLTALKIFNKLFRG